MFQQISFLKAENVGIERTAYGTARRSSLIGRTIRKLGGQMFTQIFTPMTWHNSSGSCTRGAATCTTWLLGQYAARIRQSDKKNQLSTGLPNNIKSCSWIILGAARSTERDAPHAYCSHSTAQTTFTQPTFFINQKYATAMIGTVYIHQGFYYAFKAQCPLISKGYHLKIASLLPKKGTDSHIPIFHKCILRIIDYKVYSFFYIVLLKHNNFKVYCSGVQSINTKTVEQVITD